MQFYAPFQYASYYVVLVVLQGQGQHLPGNNELDDHNILK